MRQSPAKGISPINRHHMEIAQTKIPGLFQQIVLKYAH